MPDFNRYTYSEIDPFMEVDVEGNIVRHYDKEAIGVWITTLLATVSGECPRSAYGSRLITFLFRPLSKSNGDLVREEIKRVIGEYVPPVTSTTVRVTVNPSLNCYEVSISFTATPNITGQISTRIKTYGSGS